MQEARFIDPILRPALALEAWSGDPIHRQRLRPGLLWLAVFQAVLGAFSFGVALLLSKAFYAWAQAVGPELPDRIFALLPESLKAGPWAYSVLDSAAGFAAAALALLAAGALCDALLREAKQEGSRRLFFNLAVRMVLPWQLFLLVPVLGWVVAPLGSALSLWRVLEKLYPKALFGRRLGVFLLGGLAATAVSFAVNGLLMALLQPLLLRAF